MGTALLSTETTTSIIASDRHVESIVENGRGEAFNASSPIHVVQWEGKMLRLKQRYMAIGHPYSFVLDGVPVVAIKRPSGNVDFYHVP